MHRRDDARRVPQVHRARRGPRAPLPARHGRGADASSRRSRSCSGSASATSSTTRSRSPTTRSGPPRTSRSATSRTATCPDKAIDLIDEAASRVRLRYASAPPPLREAQKELERLGRDKDAAVNSQEYDEASRLRELEAHRQGEGGRPARRVAGPGRRRPADGRRGGDRPGRRDVDRHPGDPHRPGGVGAPAPDGGPPPQAGDRPAGGDRHHLARRAPRARRPQGPQAPDRLLRLPRPDGRRQDRARQGPRRVHVRQRGRAHQGRHERVHGAPQREPARRAPRRATSASTRAAS